MSTEVQPSVSLVNNQILDKYNKFTEELKRFWEDMEADHPADIFNLTINIGKAESGTSVNASRSY